MSDTPTTSDSANTPNSTTTSDTPILETEDLETYFRRSTNVLDTVLNRKQSYVNAVDGVSLSLGPREIKGIVGESGCGKSTFLKTVARLIEPTGGVIRYRGERLDGLDKAGRLAFHSDVQMIFQDPYNSLDPKMTVREALREPLVVHNMDDREARIRDVLARVELNPPERFIDQLPSALSGGERQRVSIARALILEPKVLLADEPVSMLDVSTQAAILRMLRDLSVDLDISMFYVSHNISTVAYLCDEINVMYLGRVIESGKTMDIIDDPKHPYSKALINAVPIPDPHNDREYTTLEGSTPDPIDIGAGCRFRDRCPERMEICEKTPRNVSIEDGQNVACHLYYDHESQEEPIEQTVGE